MWETEGQQQGCARLQKRETNGARNTRVLVSIVKRHMAEASRRRHLTGDLPTVSEGEWGTQRWAGGQAGRQASARAVRAVCPGP